MKEEKKTKIVVTVGPSIKDVDVLVKMKENGMDIARINFSHSDYDSATPYLQNIKEAQKKIGKHISVLQDLSGPKIRTGEFAGEEIVLKKNSTVEIFVKKVLGNENFFSVDYKKLLTDVKIGHRILLNDGKQELKVLSVGKNSLKVRVVVGGMIRSKRGVNLPDSKLSISALTPKDKKDIKFALDFDVDFVAFSFVKTAGDVRELRGILNKNKSKSMIISKIETPQAVENFDEILEESDGIMVARGDLAVEVEAHKVPKIQKDIIRKCNIAGKPVITATQMLDSMISSPVPTRAEVSDIYNAIADGTDALMLSEETAMGKYPVKSINLMSKVALEAEDNIDHKKFVIRGVVDNKKIPVDIAISRHAVKTADDIDAKAIIVFTESGKTLRNVSRYRSEKPVYVFSPNIKSLGQSSISFGAISGICQSFKEVKEAMYFSKK
jgi:pyruvate kinase